MNNRIKSYKIIYSTKYEILEELLSIFSFYPYEKISLESNKLLNYFLKLWKIEESSHFNKVKIILMNKLSLKSTNSVTYNLKFSQLVNNILNLKKLL